MSFKVGDRVMLTRHISDLLKPGETATVTSVYERHHGKYVMVDWNQHSNTPLGGWDLSRFRLIHSPKMEDTQAFTLEELTEWQDAVTNASTG